jgi:hypothetical protein
MFSCASHCFAGWGRCGRPGGSCSLSGGPSAAGLSPSRGRETAPLSARLLPDTAASIGCARSERRAQRWTQWRELSQERAAADRERVEAVHHMRRVVWFKVRCAFGAVTDSLLRRPGCVPSDRARRCGRWRRGTVRTATPTPQHAADSHRRAECLVGRAGQAAGRKQSSASGSAGNGRWRQQPALRHCPLGSLAIARRAADCREQQAPAASSVSERACWRKNGSLTTARIA